MAVDFMILKILCNRHHLGLHMPSDCKILQGSSHYESLDYWMLLNPNVTNWWPRHKTIIISSFSCINILYSVFERQKMLSPSTNLRPQLIISELQGSRMKMEKSHMWQILILLLNVNNEPKHGEKKIYIYF